MPNPKTAKAAADKRMADALLALAAKFNGSK
jgi:hypothetical protein